MRYGIISVAIIAFQAEGVPANADYAKGLDAYEKGDYSTALKEWESIAEQGDIRAQTMRLQS